MRIIHIATPISGVDDLRIGDQIYVSGLVAILRDQAQKRFIEARMRNLWVPDIEGLPIFHCGPLAYIKDGRWIVNSIGPTTSARMERDLPVFLRLSGARMVIGKGGVSRSVADEMAKLGAIYCAYPGGASAFLLKTLRRVVDVYWLDLGIPEALWIMEFENLGPLTVAIDLHGGNLYSQVEDSVKVMLDRLLGGR
ncbi:MAG: FumA C-terminus/TtdB family hydratase beta subunit [Nitrososphaerota archaeon]|nr:FumA C-terminus/TtdB family hydratase beta subunit [Candidatus Bathyarchaeota archaeon]MDW8061685.1 FumA C-terminus/TtdB family hydratase beta subunit [Nitrososphaerota archaeon]